MVRICTYTFLYRLPFRRFKSSSQACILPIYESPEKGPSLNFGVSSAEKAFFPLSSVERQLISRVRKNTNLPDKKLSSLIWCIKQKQLDNSIPLFFSVLYRGNVHQLPMESVVALMSLISQAKPELHNSIYHETSKWLLNIGFTNDGWKQNHFFEAAALVVQKYFPDHILVFLNFFARSASQSQLPVFNCSQIVGRLFSIFLEFDPQSQFKQLFLDTRFSWSFRVSIIEALLKTKHTDAAFDLVLSCTPWIDSKSDFIRLCRLLLPMNPVLYEAELVKLGEKLCDIPVQDGEGDRLKEAYFLLTRDVHLLKLPLGLAIDIYTALEKDNILPPWPFYTTLLSRLKDVSYDVVKIIYSAILKRCEGPPPTFALLSPTNPISKKTLVGPFTALIQAASLNKDLQTLDSAYSDLIRLQIPCDEIVYIVLFNHLRHLGDHKSIYQLYCYLKETKFPMTAKLFASALDGLGRSPEYHSRANHVYQDAKACGAHFSIECISVLAAIKVRSGSYSQVVRMWSASEENILSHHLLSPHFVSLLLKSHAREARDPFCIIEIWRKIKLSCPEFRFTGGNYIVALSHLVRLHFRPSAGPDPSFKWPRGLVSSSPDAESHFLEVLSDLPSSLTQRETAFLPHDLRHLRWFADTFPLVQKLLTDLDVKI